ncbi:hypothetical protein BJX68DRAFT_10338 [Aspergillus pseudodeflectus]|uniref:Fungal-specific transcription factor domain-containing protein n=1 Tax=Aspergillus pseudodeflectus TaxID=176178 RepID=A0ABR4LC41_9EURO
MAHMPKQASSKPNAGIPPMTGQQDFMFVDFQGDGCDGVSFGQRQRVFVQKRFHREKKQASIDRLKSRVPANRARVLQHGVDKDKDKESQDAAAGTDAKQLTRVQVRHRELSLTARPSQRHGDPFSAAAAPMTGKLWMYLHHFTVHIVSISYPVDAPRMEAWWARHAVASPAVLQTCAWRAAEHKALLASSQGMPSAVIRKSINDSLYYRLSAIKSINESIRHPVTPATESTVLLVSAQLGNESFCANLDVLPAHAKGLTTLVAMVGGLEALDHLMLSTIYQGALMLAALEDTVPLFPMLPKFRHGTLHEPKIFNVKERIQYQCEVPGSLSSLGIRFTTAPWSATIIHPKMKYLVEAFRRLIHHFEVATIYPKIVAPTDNDLFVLMQHELLSTRYTSPAGGEDSKSTTPNINDALRLSLLVYLYTRVSQFQNLPIMRCMVENFRQSLISADVSYFHATAPDLLFWILFIGGMASQGYSSHPWFVAHLADVARDLGLQEWESQVRPLVGEFFYTDRPGQTAAEDLWSELVLLAGPWRYIAPKPRLVVIEMD